MNVEEIDRFGEKIICIFIIKFSYFFLEPTPVGLINMRVNCFINSALQCLYYLIPRLKLIRHTCSFKNVKAQYTVCDICIIRGYQCQPEIGDYLCSICGISPHDYRLLQYNKGIALFAYLGINLRKCG